MTINYMIKEKKSYSIPILYPLKIKKGFNLLKPLSLLVGLTKQFTNHFIDDLKKLAHNIS